MQQGLLQIALTLIILIAIAPVFGNYMARVYMGQKTLLDPAIKPREQIIYRPEVREFHVRLQPLNASDDCTLELWSLDYKKPFFEDEYNLKLVATLEQTLVPV
jgi:hypothetical protein